MTEKAYVLIETRAGKTRQVVEAIRKLPGLTSVEAITGPYDAVAVLQAETLNDIGELIVSKVHTAAGISRTVTCLAV